jgi:hypothetical protein
MLHQRVKSAIHFATEAASAIYLAEWRADGVVQNWQVGRFLAFDLRPLARGGNAAS